uniref:Uncharacterized protein n=1 Tax=Lactuca sativa TaxID=4236 RepID=A0A9R1USJ7_LACSA|nr:hypothetical protein LSAT_V11C800439340 [Lactuca sativa]
MGIKSESSSLVDDYSNVIGEHVYKSDVPVQFIPFECLIFKSLKLSIHTRFDNNIIKKKHVICNRGGKNKKKSCKTLGTSDVRRKRKSNSRFIGYQAKIIFEYVYGTPNYEVSQFDELDNHPFKKRSDLKKARQMSYSEKEFIVCAST